MTRRFCSICGKVTEELIENRCKECYLKEKSLIDIPEKLEVRICGGCMGYFRKGRWMNTGDEARVMEDASLVAIEDSISVDLGEARYNVELGDVKESSKKLYHIPFTVKAKGKLDGIPVEISRSSAIKVRVELCADCSRRRGGYYEAVLQIRGEGPLGKEEKAEVRDAVIKGLASMGDRRAFISDEAELKGGLDFYVGSAKAAKKMARGLKEEFGGRISESSKLVGMKDGKDLYRVSIAVRIKGKEKN